VRPELRLSVACLLLTSLLAGAATAAVPKIDWPPALYNPKSLDDDVVLPVPCGGALVLRRVETEAPRPFDDQQAEVGGDAVENGYAEHSRPVHVAGGFEVASPEHRHLLLGKYEVTRLQYLAVAGTGEDGTACPGTDLPDASLPATGVGWHDAARFGHLYSLWLRREAAGLPDCDSGAVPCLPREDGEIAFVRLPTEAEWEFAVRGGTAVSPAVFRDDHFPMPEGMEDYVWFSDNARGKVRPIGLRRPNPLGLHDMLGNVAEMIFEPFRLTRLDRSHGQTGGALIRGGGIHASREQIRSSLRLEVPFYHAQGALAAPDIGFRVAAAVPVLTSGARLAAFRQDARRLGTEPADARAVADKPVPPKVGNVPKEDPVEELEALAAGAGDMGMRDRLLGLVSVFRSNRQDLYDQRDRAARETLRFGGIFCQKLGDDGRKLDTQRQLLATCREVYGAEHERCRQRSAALLSMTAVMDENLGIYIDAVIRTAQNYPAPVLADQLAALKAELDRRRVSAVSVYPETFFEQVEGYLASGRAERELWSQRCVGLAKP